MLTAQEIQQALHASRVVPLDVANPHGPLGLEHLAEVVARLVGPESAPSERERVQRPMSLPLEAWEKLDQLARVAMQAGSHPVTASEVAAALIEQLIATK